jgi:hypothetical protein
MVLIKLDIHVQNIESRPFLGCIKINSKWGKEVNKRHEMFKILEQNQRKTLQDIGIRTFSRLQ